MQIFVKKSFVLVTLAALLLLMLALMAVMVVIEYQKNRRNTRRVYYADCNATTPVFVQSTAAMISAAKTAYANPSSIHDLGKQAKAVLELQRTDMAKMLACKPSELFFTGGATESNNAIIHHVVQCSVTSASNRRNKSGAFNIITTPIEHASVSEALDACRDTIKKEKNGKVRVNVRTCKVDDKGRIDFRHYDSLIDDDTLMSCIILGNNEIGVLQDARALRDIHRTGKKARRVHLHLDMTQVVGRYKVDLAQTGAHSATMSAHKFHGPKGVGCLFVSSLSPLADFAPHPLLKGGHQERGRRGGTENVPGVCGMAAALKRCYDLLEKGEAERVRRMRDEVWHVLKRHIPELIVHGDPGHTTLSMYNTLCVSVPVNSRELVQRLGERRVYLGTGCACASGGASAVLKALGQDEDAINGSLRISFGFMNQSDEARYVAQSVVDTVKTLRKLE